MRFSSSCLALLATAMGVAVMASAAAVEPAAVTAIEPADGARLARVDAVVEQARRQFDVPGIAVAIVRDGKVVMERGYGVRELGKPAPVTATTPFAIASNTKAFTAAALSILADQGKLKMDDRVIDHLPGFRMSDAWVTSQMRIRDLLSHRSGLSLGAGDLLFWPPSDYSVDEVVRRLAQVPLQGGFRDRYAYDNILYAVAQKLIEQVSGQPYPDFIQRHILDPLGMDGVRFNECVSAADQPAVGHARAGFTALKPVPRMSWANNRGAGDLYASVHDLAKWMNLQLAGGRLPDGTPLFSEQRQQEMWSVVTPIPVAKPAVPELAPAVPNFAGYGEGWSLSDYRGHKLVWHSGGWPGMVSRTTLVPDIKLGIVVLTNQEAGAAFNAVTYAALDAFLGVPGDAASNTDWVAAHAAAVAKANARADASWKEHLAARDARSKPSLPPAGYAARYRDPWYGEVVIEQKAGTLRMRFTHTPLLVGTLEHWQHDTFIVHWDERTLNADAFASFALTPDGKVRELRMQPVSPRTDFSFDFQDLVLTPVQGKAAE